MTSPSTTRNPSSAMTDARFVGVALPHPTAGRRSAVVSAKPASVVRVHFPSQVATIAITARPHRLPSMAKKRGPKTPMTDEHKAALAKGRAEGRVVRDYLEGLRATKPKRGRKRTPETINRRLEAIDGELTEAKPVEELLLVQERRDLEAELEAMSNSIDMQALEDAFVGVAKSYSTSKNISYASWREVGVEPRVLKRAGISRAA